MHFTTRSELHPSLGPALTHSACLSACACLLLQMYLMSLTYSSLSQLWLALFPNGIAANVVNGLFMNLFFMFAGLFIRPSSIPEGWRWFYCQRHAPTRCTHTADCD